jgi:hypothetical protein
VGSELDQLHVHVVVKIVHPHAPHDNELDHSHGFGDSELDHPYAMGDCDHDHSHYGGVRLHVADGVLRTMSRNGLSLTKKTWLTMLPALS